MFRIEACKVLGVRVSDFDRNPGGDFGFDRNPEASGLGFGCMVDIRAVKNQTQRGRARPLALSHKVRSRQHGKTGSQLCFCTNLSTVGVRAISQLEAGRARHFWRLPTAFRSRPAGAPRP